MSDPRDNAPPGVPADPDELLALSRNLRRLATRLVGDGAAADDLVQDAWLTALDGDGPQVRDLSGWLRGVMRRLALRQRARKRRRAELEHLMAARDAVVDETHLIEQVSSYNLLRRTAEELRAPYAELMTLRYFEERSVEEIAAQLGRTESTVRSQLSRGMVELREALDRKHHGDRAAWSALLLPLVVEERKLASVGVGAGAAIVAVLTTLLIALGVWRPWESDSPALPLAGEARIQVADAGSELPLVQADDNERTPVDSSDEDPTTTPTVPPPEALDPEPEAEEKTRRLELTVVSPEGVPLDEVYVRLYKRLPQGPFDRGPIQLDIGERDFIRHDGPEEYAVRLTVRSTGEAWSGTTFVPLPVEGRSLQIQTRGSSQTLEGRVVDEFDVPIPGAKLVCTPDQRQGTRRLGGGVTSVVMPEARNADENGEFQIRGLIRGAPHRIYFGAAGFMISSQILQTEEEVIEATFVLQSGGSIRGEVKLPDGSPAVGARVWEPGTRFAVYDLTPDPAVCDESGFFELGGLSPGDHHIFAVESGEPKRFASSVATIADGEATEWGATLQPNHGLTIRVLDPRSEPISSGMSVLYRQSGKPNWAKVAMPDEEGLMRFEYVPDVPLALSFKRGDEELVTILKGAHQRQEEYIVEYPDPEDTTAQIRGFLLDGQGRPVQRAQVGGVAGWDIFYADVGATSGEFTAKNLKPQVWQLQAIVQGLGAANMGSHEVLPGNDIDLGNLRLPELGQVAFDWGTIRPTADSPWMIHVMRPKAEMDPKLVRSIVEPLPNIELLPGSYRLGSSSGERLIQFEVPPEGFASVGVESD